MSYILRHDMPGLRKGAVIHFDKKKGQYYAPKDSYIEFYWFTKTEVETNKKWFKLRPFFTILMVIFWQVSFGQIANWTVGNEKSILRYEVQDSVTKWQTLKQVVKGKTSYTYPITITPAWYRIKAVGDSNFYTQAIYVTAVNSATITSPVYHTTNLTWTVANERNVSYYWIQKTRNVTTTQVTKYQAKGGGNYKYYMSRTIYKYTYKITPIFKDLTTGTPANFK